MQGKPSPEQEEIHRAVDQVMARVALRRISKLVEQERQAEESKMTASLYMFVAFCLFILGMAVLAPENTRNARAIAQLLGGVPHRPIVMQLMLLSLLATATLGAGAAYVLLWWRGRHRNACLAGSAAALLLAVLLYWSPQVLRVLQPLIAP